MTDTTPPDSTAVDPLTRPLPAVLLRGTLVLGALFVGFALALGGPRYLLRGDLVAGTVVAATGGYVLTRIGRRERVSPTFSVVGIVVGFWLLFVTGFHGLTSPLARVSVVLGACTVVVFGVLLRAVSRAGT